ncbi:hypothetical protein [Polaromonas glacialis]|uniref:hypothetical protein n=1 Tax=Polaromonas glacialis TaxID=866564 RepID=UPI0012EB1DAB|nr:hypothetical protein [Polaromonas glacialis]
MARSRNIKPGFFTNDVLGELPALTRLMFAGIWTLCDREGRLEDRPKKIRAETLPYDVCDADEMLQSLEKAGFLHRYEADGQRVIQVLAWHKHQNPHVKEAASTLPPPGGVTALPEEAPDKNSSSTGQAPDDTLPLPALAGLIPDSLLLIPDSLIKSTRKLRAVSLEISLTEYLERCKAESKKPIPADHAIHAYCLDATITDDMLQIAWLVFKDRHLTNPTAKKYTDWPAAFANSIKDRWYRLWSVDAQGQIAWTANGLQEKLVIENRMNEAKEPDHAPA